MNPGVNRGGQPAGMIGGPGVGAGVSVSDGVTERVKIGRIASSPDDYGIKIVSSDGSTVIIDGNSDTYKIVVSGTISTASFARPGGTSSTVSLALGVATASDYIGWAQRGSGVGSYHLPALTYDPATALVSEKFDMELSVAAGLTSIRVATDANSPAGTEAARLYRYNILAEVAF